LAAEASKQSMVYEVYAGGVHAVQSTLDIETTSDDRYNVSMGAKTRGFLGKLAPWSGTFESKGWRVNDDMLRPELHRSIATWRGEAETKDYKYAKDGTFKSLIIDEHDKPAETRKTDAKLTNGTTDAFTATLMMLEAYNKTGKCEGTSLVFDGKRSFDLKFVHKKTEELTASRYNIYEGTAAKCTAEVIPREGKWYEKPRGWLSIQEQGRDKGTMPTLWIAQIEEGAPAIPVKVLVKTDYGALFMHLVEHKGAE